MLLYIRTYRQADFVFLQAILNIKGQGGRILDASKEGNFLEHVEQCQQCHALVMQKWQCFVPGDPGVLGSFDTKPGPSKLGHCIL